MSRTLPRSLLHRHRHRCSGNGQLPAAETFQFADIVGWWSAEPELRRRDLRASCCISSKRTASRSVRLSLLGIGGYDVPIGTVTIDGMTLDMKPYPFPLQFDPQHGHAARTSARGGSAGLQDSGGVSPHRAVGQAGAADLGFPASARALDLRHRRRGVGRHRARCGERADLRRQRCGHAARARCEGRAALASSRPASRSRRGPRRSATRVYVASDSGFLYKLDKRSGAERWRAKIDRGSPGAHPDRTRKDRVGIATAPASSPTASASTSAAATARCTRSIVATGKEQWRVQTQDMMTATPALYRDLVLFADFKGIVQAVGASDGKARWTYDARLPVAGDLVVDADRVFVGSRTYDLIALDAANGKELWKHYYWFSWIESPPVVRDGVVYTGSSDGVGVFAIDARTASCAGKRRCRAGRGRVLQSASSWSSPRRSGLGAYPGARAGSLVGIDRASGAIRWMYLEPPSADDAGEEGGVGLRGRAARWATTSSTQRTCRAASMRSSAMHTACSG